MTRSGAISDALLKGVPRASDPPVIQPTYVDGTVRKNTCQNGSVAIVSLCPTQPSISYVVTTAARAHNRSFRQDVMNFSTPFAFVN